MCLVLFLTGVQGLGTCSCHTDENDRITVRSPSCLELEGTLETAAFPVCSLDTIYHILFAWNTTSSCGLNPEVATGTEKEYAVASSKSVTLNLHNSAAL